MRIVGLDIGGANLKAHDTDGQTRCRPHAVWKSPEQLHAALGALLQDFEPYDMVAVTMTAELADCYATKKQGITSILGQLSQATDRPVMVWQTGAEFVTPAIAVQIPSLVAASNWHALATWVGRLVPEGPGLLLDMGSTTTDIIPLLDGFPATRGMTDRERLESGELVYSGMRRTPLCAIVHSVPLNDSYCPLAAEWFATTLDVHLLLGNIPEDPNDCETANQQPATHDAAYDRIARMLCSDRTEIDLETVFQTARFIGDVQRQRIAGAIDRVLSEASQPGQILVSGTGQSFLQSLLDGHPRLATVPRVNLAEMFSDQWAEAACACAVARLAEERISIDRID